MSDTKEKSGGGFHFGNVGGNVKMKAGGDIGGGDKTTTTTTITKGFAGDEQKQQFQAEIGSNRDQRTEAEPVGTSREASGVNISGGICCFPSCTWNALVSEAALHRGPPRANPPPTDEA
jgi:hypothetical protein